MFILMGFGFYLSKYNYLSEFGVNELINILFKLCTPMIIINVFNVDFSVEYAVDFFYTVIISLICISISMIISNAFFKNSKTEWYAASFANAGFMAIPLSSSILGEESIKYVSAFIVASNICMWTVGVYKLTESRESISLLNIIKTPAMKGLTIGLLVFISPIKPPYVITSAISNVAKINTVLAMLVMGNYISSIKFKKLKGCRLTIISSVRLILIPFISICVLILISMNSIQKKAIVLALSAPTAVTASMMAMKYGKDFEYSASIVSVTTCLSIISIPLILKLL